MAVIHPLPCRVLGCSAASPPTLRIVRTFARTTVRAPCGTITRTASRSVLRCSARLAPRWQVVKRTQLQLIGMVPARQKSTRTMREPQHTEAISAHHVLQHQYQVKHLPVGVSLPQNRHQSKNHNKKMVYLYFPKKHRHLPVFLYSFFFLYHKWQVIKGSLGHTDIYVYQHKYCIW